MMEFNYEMAAAIVGAGIGVLGLVKAYVTSKKLTQAIEAVTSFGKLTVTFLRIDSDGVISVEETEEMGREAVAFFETCEGIFETGIINRAEVEWIKPKE